MTSMGRLLVVISMAFPQCLQVTLIGPAAWGG
jgi:hypothetical protein